MALYIRGRGNSPISSICNTSLVLLDTSSKLTQAAG